MSKATEAKMRLKAALVFMFFGTVSCLQVLDECVPKKRLETCIKGKEMKLRVWVPEIGDATFLTLISENDRTGILRKIEIRKNFATVQTKDEETVSPELKIPIQNNSLPHGWVNFMVTSKENFTVTVPDVKLTLIDVQDVVQDENIIIKGSSVAANCMLPTLQWEVSARQEALIPLSPNASHDFSLFSRVPFTPRLAVGPAGEEHRNFLSLTRVFQSEFLQMSPFLLHNFTLDCAIGEKLTIYYIQAGDSEDQVGSFPREATSLSLIATGTDDYIIVQGKKKEPDQEGGRTGGDQGEDQNGVGDQVPVELVWITIINVAVATLSVIIFILRKGKAKCRGVENYVDDQTESTKLGYTCTQITEE